MPKKQIIIFLIAFVLIQIACARTTAVSEAKSGDETVMGRTFHRIKRLQQLILAPILLHKLSIIGIMLGFLILLTFKGLLIGKMILLLQLAAGFFKFGIFFQKIKAHFPWHTQSYSQGSSLSGNSYGYSSPYYYSSHKLPSYGLEPTPYASSSMY